MKSLSCWSPGFSLSERPPAGWASVTYLGVRGLPEKLIIQGVLVKQTLLCPVIQESSAAFQDFQVVAVQLLLSLAALLSLHHTFCRRKEEWEVSGSTTKTPWPCELVLCPHLWLEGGFSAGVSLPWSAAFNQPLMGSAAICNVLQKGWPKCRGEGALS